MNNQDALYTSRHCIAPGDRDIRGNCIVKDKKSETLEREKERKKERDRQTGRQNEQREMSERGG